MQQHNHYQHRTERLPNTLDTAPNLELIEIRYANGATFNGFFSQVDQRVFTATGAPQALGDFYRWAPLR